MARSRKQSLFSATGTALSVPAAGLSRASSLSGWPPSPRGGPDGRENIEPERSRGCENSRPDKFPEAFCHHRRNSSAGPTSGTRLQIYHAQKVSWERCAHWSRVLAFAYGSSRFGSIPAGGEARLQLVEQMVSYSGRDADRARFSNHAFQLFHEHSGDET